MVQDNRDDSNSVSINVNFTKEDIPMNAKSVVPRVTKKVVNRSAVRISDQEYKSIALALRQGKLDATPTNVVITAAPLLSRKISTADVNQARISKLNQLIRDQDAVEANTARAKITGTVEGLKKGEMADLLIKSIVTAAVDAATIKTLEGTRKLLLAQESRFQQRMSRTEKVLAALCVEWGIKVPELEEVTNLPVIEASGQVVRLPRVLVYGIQANQKQATYDLVRSWDLLGVADIDVGFSTDRIASIRRDYDVIVFNRHYVRIDDIRELKNHGRKVVEAYGSLSNVASHLQVELLELAIQAKRKEEQK